MNKTTARYRLRGRASEWGPRVQAPAQKVSTNSNDDQVDFRHALAVRDAIFQLFTPDIREWLSTTKLFDLAHFDFDYYAWRRSCAWARCLPSFSPAIRIPRAIISYVKVAYDLNAQAQAYIASAIDAETAEHELRGLAQFKGEDPGVLGISTLLGQIAALALFENTPWGGSQRRTILHRALESPEMSYYFAAATTPDTPEWDLLVDRISASPRFSFAALQLPHLLRSPFTSQAAIKMTNSLLRNPLLHWAHVSCLRGSGLTVPDIARHGIESSPEFAALFIALRPNHPRVDDWMQLLARSPELAYYVRRILRLTNRFEEESRLACQLGPIARLDPIWAFHWIRDFGEDEEAEALSLVPHLEWVAELMDLGVLSVHHANAVDTQAGDTLAPDHWLRTSFVLFAAEKINSDESKD